MTRKETLKLLQTLFGIAWIKSEDTDTPTETLYRLRQATIDELIAHEELGKGDGKATYIILDGMPNDNVLIGNAVRNACKGFVKAPRWHHVKETFCVGKTVACALCIKFDIDPDEIINPNDVWGGE